MRRLPLACAFVTAFASGPVAFADDAAPSPPPPSPPPEAPLPFPALPPGREPVITPGHWSRDPPRPFVSLRLDLGYLYVKPRLSFGYGKPFFRWAGLDVVPSITTDSGGAYSGLRLQLDWFEARAGARYVHAFGGQFLTPERSFTIVDLDEYTGHTANYVDLEAEVAAAIPAGPGSVLVSVLAESIQLVPAGYDVFDETLHVVVGPPPVYRARLGYSLLLGREHTGRLGVLAEDLELPDRSSRVLRAGLTGSFDLDDHLALIATILVPIVSPDSLGLVGADYTELGIRYRWATGHKHELPPEALPTLEP